MSKPKDNPLDHLGYMKRCLAMEEDHFNKAAASFSSLHERGNLLICFGTEDILKSLMVLFVKVHTLKYAIRLMEGGMM